MNRHHRYYRNDREITRAEAFDGGVLRDGVRFTSRLTAMDSADERIDARHGWDSDDTPYRITDWNGSTQLSRPGWRVPNTNANFTPSIDMNVGARQAAYDAVEFDLINAYKNIRDDDGPPTGVGSKDLRRGKKLGAGLPSLEYKEELEDPDDGDDGEQWGAGERPRRRRKKRTEENTKEDTMARLYMQYDRANATAYLKTDAAAAPSGEFECPSCEGTGKDSNDDDCPSCNGGGTVEEAFQNTQTHTESDDSLVKYVNVPVRPSRAGFAAASATDAADIRKMQRDHAATMERLYSADENYKREAWRNPE